MSFFFLLGAIFSCGPKIRQSQSPHFHNWLNELSNLFPDCKPMEPLVIIELQSLTNAANKKKEEGNIAASIPYLAKIVHILDTQTPKRNTTQNNQKAAQSLELMTIDARREFADALFKTHQFTESEVQIGLVCKSLEKYLRKLDPSESDILGIESKLLASYDAWADCYENLGNAFLASKIQQRKQKLVRIKTVT